MPDCFKCMAPFNTTFGHASFQLYEDVKYGHPKPKKGHRTKVKFAEDGKIFEDHYRRLMEDEKTLEDCAKSCAESDHCFKFLFVKTSTECFHFDSNHKVRRESTYNFEERTRTEIYPEIGTAGN